MSIHIGDSKTVSHLPDTPKVSIIVPVYNVEPYLARCLDSILAQTMPSFELILINDGSTDRSAEICERYDQKDVRIRTIHQKNQGVSVARNQGILAAKAPYVQFVDPDDWIEPDMTEKLLQAIEMEKVQLTACSVNIYFEKSSNREDRAATLASIAQCKAGLKEAKLFSMIPQRSAESGANCIFLELTAPWNKLFIKSILDRYNIWFDEELYQYEDTLFVMEYCSRIDQVFTLDSPLYYYRIRSESATMSEGIQKDWLRNANLAYDKIGRVIDHWAGLDTMTQNRARSQLNAYYVDRLIRCVMLSARFSDRNSALPRFRELCRNNRFRDCLPDYRPRPGDSRLVPLLLKYKFPLLAWFAARWRTKKG